MAIPRAIVAVAVMAAVAGLANATNFDVSWNLSTNYTQWVSGKTFRAGDTLTFNYTSSHDVVEVSSSAYATCNATGPVSKSATGNTLVVLGAPGKRYFICGVAGHCTTGMKIEIDVVTASSPSPSVSPAAPTPPAASPPAPSTAPPGRTRTTAKVAFGVALMVFAL
ncbi:Early nodulin-like protein [Musa troglodytarum]|uniref:Early nodulin-like protein n=1 Tax=Musa troglodytarum TaxID=320322 RepID=A0A9E7KN73_9LILI|nr:Early nodulin-like protein [Musa troglodytarum]